MLVGEELSDQLCRIEFLFLSQLVTKVTKIASYAVHVYFITSVPFVEQLQTYRICSIRRHSCLVAAYNSIAALNKIVAALE